MSGAHAKYSGSNAHRFMRCPGQPRLAAQVPELPDGPDAVYRLEGDKAHDLLARTLSGRRDTMVPEMHDAVMAVVDYVRTLFIQHADLVVHSELPVTFPQEIVPPEDAAGTADVVAFSKAAQKVWVIDFKYGVGETVEAYDNAQIKFYATGAVWRTAFKELYGVIIQPRSFRGPEPRIVAIPAWELVEFQSDVERAIRDAEKADAPLLPGTWCHFCPAGAICPARDKLALQTISPDGRPLAALDRLVLPAPVDLSMDRIGHILEMKDQVTKWLTDVEKYAFLQAMAGEHIPGHKLVEAAPRRRWADWSDAPTMRRELYVQTGVDNAFSESKIIALTNAEKIVAAAFKDVGLTAAQAKEWFAQFTIKESSGELSLAPISDKRPAADRVKNDFAGIVPAQIGG